MHCRAALCATLCATLLALVLLAAPPVAACATCACGDPALVGAGAARPSGARARVGTELRWLSSSTDMGIVETARGVRAAVVGDVTIVDGLAIDAQVPVIVAERTALGFSALAASLADADVAVRGIVLADRAIAARAYAGLRGGLVVPTSALGRDPRGARLDTGAWAPHAELFGAIVRDRWFISGATGARVPLPEDIGGRGFLRGPVAVAAMRAQLQPRANLGVFVSVSAEAAGDVRLEDAYVKDTGGVRALVSSGASSVVAEDVVVELTVAVPVVQTQPEKLGAIIALGVVFDVGRR